MDENLLAAKMMEMAKSEMKYVKSKGLLGENPSWGKPQEKIIKEKRNNGAGRPYRFGERILSRLEIGLTTDEIVAELGCSRNIVNQYRRKRRLEQNAASSHAA
jgi:hypothetical protein